jgi:AraC-like DNA-binding protein
MKNMNHEIINVKAPAIEILICRRDIIDDWNFSNRHSPYWRLYRTYNDVAYVCVNGEQIHLQNGEIYLIAPETYFDTKTIDGQLDKFYIHFIAGETFANCSNFFCRLPHSQALMAIIEIASQRLLNRTIDYHLQLNCTAIVSMALDLLPKKYLRSFENIEDKLIKIWRLIQDNPNVSYSNKNLANMAMMSESAFNHKFNSSFGISPLHFALEQKIRKASLMLLNGTQSIPEIAEECGFCDRYYFSKIFKKRRNISPAKYRQSHSKTSTL